RQRKVGPAGVQNDRLRAAELGSKEGFLPLICVFETRGRPLDRLVRNLNVVEEREYVFLEHTLAGSQRHFRSGPGAAVQCSRVIPCGGEEGFPGIDGVVQAIESLIGLAERPIDVRRSGGGSILRQREVEPSGYEILQADMRQRQLR